MKDVSSAVAKGSSGLFHAGTASFWDRGLIEPRRIGAGAGSRARARARALKAQHSRHACSSHPQQRDSKTPGSWRSPRGFLAGYMVKFSALVALLLLLATFSVSVRGSCVELNNCSGHGRCSLYDKCVCNEGYGAVTDITSYRAPDCSARVCPYGSSWADMPLNTGEVHRDAECSDRGICNRVSGKCKCDKGFEGHACQRWGCINDCSGHGKCLSMERLASQKQAQPVSDATTYVSSSQFNGLRIDDSTWDSRKIMGCLCESSWAVGLLANETQEAEWFGPDCSLRHCPSAKNPRTPANETDATDCGSLSRNGTIGEAGNLCQVDCGNQGICDYSTGTCSCFRGQYGSDCAIQDQMPAAEFALPTSKGDRSSSYDSLGYYDPAGGSSSNYGDVAAEYIL